MAGAGGKDPVSVLSDVRSTLSSVVERVEATHERVTGVLGCRRAPLESHPPRLAAGDLQAADPVEAGLAVLMQLLVALAREVTG